MNVYLCSTERRMMEMLAQDYADDTSVDLLCEMETLPRIGDFINFHGFGARVVEVVHYVPSKANRTHEAAIWVVSEKPHPIIELQEQQRANKATFNEVLPDHPVKDMLG